MWIQLKETKMKCFICQEELDTKDFLGGLCYKCASEPDLQPIYNYKCNCGGEFNEPEKEQVGNGDSYISKCPFCNQTMLGINKGE